MLNLSDPSKQESKNLILWFFATSVIQHVLRFQMNQGIRTYWKLGEPSRLMNMNMNININYFLFWTDLLIKGYCLHDAGNTHLASTWSFNVFGFNFHS